VLLTVADPEQAVHDLITLAIEGGGPDNVTCIVADVMPAEAANQPGLVPGGAS
jgi:PPM family protein phosphatase